MNPEKATSICKSCSTKDRSCCSVGPLVKLSEKSFFSQKQTLRSISPGYLQLDPPCEHYVNNSCDKYDDRPCDCRMYPLAVTVRGYALDFTCKLIPHLTVFDLHNMLLTAEQLRSQGMFGQEYIDAVMAELEEDGMFNAFFFIGFENVHNFRLLQAALDRAHFKLFPVTEEYDTYWDDPIVDDIDKLCKRIGHVPKLSVLTDRCQVEFFNGPRLLHIGCMGGKFIVKCLEAGIDAYGIEPYYPIIQEGIEKYPILDGRIVCADFFTELPVWYVENQFDFVYIPKRINDAFLENNYGFPKNNITAQIMKLGQAIVEAE